MAISNASGTVTNVNTYDDYGIPGSANVGRFQYTGQAWLPELGMYYYKARIYSPTLGRFMQTDPIGYGDGLNWYNYVGSDPVNGTDPSGLSEILVNGTRERPNLCINCNSRIPLNFDFEPSEFSRVANEKGEGGERIEQKSQKRGCGNGPRLVIGRYVGGTAFVGVGNKAVGGSVSVGGGLSIPLSFFRTGSLAGTQIYASATLTGLVKGIGAFVASTTGVSGGISNGPVSSFVPSYNDSGSYVIQGGAAKGAGAEVQSSGPISNLTASVTAGLARGLGAYVAGGRQANVTLATRQFGCPR